MADVKVKRADEVGAYSGPNEIPGIKFRPVGRDLGITAWGMNVLELAPNCTGYPEHDHVADGQEELYALLRGSATLQAGGKEWPLEPGVLARVGPQEKRKLVAGPQGAVILAIGGTPGKAYEPRR